MPGDPDINEQQRQLLIAQERVELAIQVVRARTELIRLITSNGTESEIAEARARLSEAEGRLQHFNEEHPLN
jgi:Spy/CpxP family protein refolding chaperone